MRKGDLSGVRLFHENGTITTYGDCINDLSKLIGKENTEKIMKNIAESEKYK